MKFKPAAFDGEREARRILFRCALIDVQGRAIGLLNTSERMNSPLRDAP